MEIYFLDRDLSVIEGPVDSFTSVVWSEKYFEPGSFTLHFPSSLAGRFIKASYVKQTLENGSVMCGRIEYINTSDDGDCEMGGHLLEALLSDRVIYGRGKYTGDLSSAVTNAVLSNLRGLEITVSEESAVISDPVALSYEWNDLSEWLYSALRPFGASYTVRLDPQTNSFVFKILRGTDRSAEGGSPGEHVVFSASFGNISSILFEKNNEEMKNVAYIEGSDGISVTVDISGEQPKREIYKKAGDISPSDFSSTEEYMASLVGRGREILAKYPEALFVASECNTEALPVYGKDYFLGDMCDVSDDALGVSYCMRLTTVDTVFENGKKSIHPSFGDEVIYIKKLLSL